MKRQVAGQIFFSAYAVVLLLLTIIWQVMHVNFLALSCGIAGLIVLICAIVEFMPAGKTALSGFAFVGTIAAILGVISLFHLLFPETRILSFLLLLASGGVLFVSYKTVISKVS